MSVTKWRDAYTVSKTNLKSVIGELGKVAICKTYGKVVYKNKHYLVLEQHTASNLDGGTDYFVIPRKVFYK